MLYFHTEEGGAVVRRAEGCHRDNSVPSRNFDLPVSLSGVAGVALAGEAGHLASSAIKEIIGHSLVRAVLSKASKNSAAALMPESERVRVRVCANVCAWVGGWV